MAHDALTKLIAENKERPIAEFPKKGGEYLLRGEGFQWVDFWREYANGDACWEESDDIEPTHFRILPDDRLALVAECQDDGYQTIIKHFPEAETLVNKIREKANRIAEGKE